MPVISLCEALWESDRIKAILFHRINSIFSWFFSFFMKNKVIE